MANISVLFAFPDRLQTAIRQANPVTLFAGSIGRSRGFFGGCAII